MEQCRATKRNGDPCTQLATGRQGLCWAHDPKNYEKRRRTAAKGGRAKASREVRIIKEEILVAIAGVKDGSLDRNIARAMFTGYSVLLEYIRLERGVYVEEELAARLDALKRDEREDAS